MKSSGIRLTDAEKEMVVREVAERIRDVAYMKADEMAWTVLNRVLDNLDSAKPEEKIVLNIKIELLVEDILQIVGRIRRRGGR